MKVSTSMRKMFLVFIKLFLAVWICGVCEGYKLLEDRAEYVTEGGVLSTSEKEAMNGLENAWESALMDHPSVVLLESRQAVLEKLKLILMKENETYPGKFSLATFNANGLQDVTAFDDYPMLRQAILGVNQTPNDKISTPSFHAVIELLQKNLTGTSLLLVTLTKPSDEDLTDDVTKALLAKNCQLSVLWMGNQTTNDYNSLKTTAEKTGGKFIFPPGDDEIIFQRSNIDLENFSNKIRFPERSTENEENEMHLTSRAAEQRITHKAVVPLIVEVASGSSLEIRPGASSQVQFTVKNNMNVAVPAIFNAKFNGIVQTVQPAQTFLPPAGTVTALVNLQPIGPSQSLSAVGTLTLFVAAANRVTARSALISLTPQTTTDNTSPKMYHKYEGDCSKYKEPQNCEHGQWSLEVTVQDEESGLLKILSEPYGLLFHSEFIAGSKTPVSASYTATCCQPIVHIWGEDLRGNYVKKSFDVFNQNLLAGEVASIVLGVLLLLLIIVVIIVAVVLIRRRNKRNLIIPRPRSGSR